MTIDFMHKVAVRVLAAASLDRLQRAVTALVEQSVSMHVTRQTSDELRALVTTDEGKDYGVTLTPTLTTCSCRDALYRGVTCKHAAVVAVQLLRSPIEVTQENVAPDLRLTKVRTTDALSRNGVQA